MGSAKKIVSSAVHAVSLGTIDLNKKKKSDEVFDVNRKKRGILGN